MIRKRECHRRCNSIPSQWVHVTEINANRITFQWILLHVRILLLFYRNKTSCFQSPPKRLCHQNVPFVAFSSICRWYPDFFYVPTVRISHSTVVIKLYSPEAAMTVWMTICKTNLQKFERYQIIFALFKLRTLLNIFL